MAHLDDHPLAGLFPLMDAAAAAELGADIAANGLHDPIWLYEGKVLDGRNRYRECVARGVAPRFECYAGPDPLGFVVSKNLRRRHLTESQRAMVAANVATARQGERTDLPPPANSPKVTQAQAADLLGVGERAVRDAVRVKAAGVPALAAAVAAGEVTVSAAAEVARLPADEQAELVAAGPEAVKTRAAAQRQARRDQAGGAPPPPAADAPPPPVTTRPMPHQTKAPRGRPAVAGAGGEVSGWAAFEQGYGKLVRGVDEYFRIAAQSNTRPHREALDLLDRVLAHMTAHHARLTNPKESA